MKFAIPESVKSEHEELHSTLVRATRAGGRTGTAANAVAAVLHPHFVKEEQFALPPLALLGPLARGEWKAEMRGVLDLTDKLKAELPGYITKVQGTGLLFSCELAPAFKCYGAGSTEEWMREHGYGVIHGGANSLRFTPHFNVGADEVDLLVDGVRRALVEGPRAVSSPAVHAAAA